MGRPARAARTAPGLRCDRSAQRLPDRPCRDGPFIVTLATLLAARGLLLAVTDEGATTYLVPKGSAFAGLGQGSVWGFGHPVLIALVLFGAGGLLLQRTSFGQTLFAVGGSSDAATLMGLPVARTKLLVYTLSGLLAGLAGALNAARLSSGVTIVGVGMELDAISAVVIGGTLLAGGAGSISGTLWGVLLLAVIQNLINQIGSLNSSYQSVVSGGFLIVVVVAQRCLARGRRAAEPSRPTAPECASNRVRECRGRQPQGRCATGGRVHQDRVERGEQLSARHTADARQGAAGHR